MSRHHLSSWLSRKELRLGDVWDWYTFQVDLINAEEARTLAAHQNGQVLVDARYFGSTFDELIAFFEDQRVEIGNAAMLGMLAATEASMMVDFIERVTNKRKDNITRGYVLIYREHKLKVSLVKHILEDWKQSSDAEAKRAIGAFIGAFKLRNWLAHGRYRKPSIGQTYSPTDVLKICGDLIRNLQLT